MNEEQKVGRRCCVCKYTIGEEPYSDGYLSKKCVEITIGEMPECFKQNFRLRDSYKKMPDICEEK